MYGTSGNYSGICIKIEKGQLVYMFDKLDSDVRKCREINEARRRDWLKDMPKREPKVSFVESCSVSSSNDTVEEPLSLEQINKEIQLKQDHLSDSFVYSSFASFNNNMETERNQTALGSLGFLHKNLTKEDMATGDHVKHAHRLPPFVQEIRKPRKLTFDEIRQLNLNRNYMEDAHNMIFYPPFLSFLPSIKPYHR